MKIKLLIAMIVGFSAIASYGFLEFNNVDLDIQSLKAISSVESFTSGFNCACSDSNQFSEGGFDSGNCNVQYLVEPSDGPDGIHGTPDDVEGVPHPDSLGLVGNMLCLWESHQDDYGGNIDWESEGCQSKYWLIFQNHDTYFWPAGLTPGLQFNDVFQTTFPYTNGFDSDDDGGEKVLGKNKKNDDFDDTGQSIKKKENPGYTLEDALKHQGISSNGEGLAKQFAREATAAILNAGHNEINYPYTVQEIIRMTQDAVVNEDYKNIKNEFRAYNQLGESLMCP